MINHPNRNRITAARNRWFRASTAWDSAARKAFGPGYTPAEATSTPELRRLAEHTERTKAHYYRLIEAAPRT
jgi:hypothetical protein